MKEMSDTVENLYTSMRDLTDTILKVRFTDLEKERMCCEELLDLAKKHNSMYAKAFAYTYLADYYLAQNNAMLSGQYLLEAKQYCSKDNYPELYLKGCHLSGFYYYMINDEQSALQFYLEASALAQEIGDVYQQCNVWNNLADMFQRRGHLEEAKGYYLKAYDTLRQLNNFDARLMTILLYNLSETYGKLNDLDNMEKCLQKCEAVKQEDADPAMFHHFCCQSGWFLLAAFSEQNELAVSIAHEILDKQFYGVEDRYVIIEFVLPIILSLIALKEETCAQRYLLFIDDYNTMNEIDLMQRLADLRVKYAEAFASDLDLAKSYQEYYKTMKKVIQTEDGVRVRGMNAKIHLQEIIRKHEKTLKENIRLEGAANVDELTGIYNRRYFNEQLDKAYEKKDTKTLGVMMLDVDYFKEYNDNYGHIHGDFVLHEVGNILEASAKEYIIPCRYGGDEFACIFVNQNDEQIEGYIKYIQTKIEDSAMEHLYSKCAKLVTLSIGYSNDEVCLINDENQILKQADQALYAAKNYGRNGWTSYHRENEKGV